MTEKKTEKKTVEDLKKAPVNLTDARNKRCEPIILSILQQMLDEGLIYNDVQYVEQKVLEYMDALFKIMIVEHQQTIFKGITDSLRHHLREAQNEQWGKDQDSISLKDIDKVLKKRFKRQKLENKKK